MDRPLEGLDEEEENVSLMVTKEAVQDSVGNQNLYDKAFQSLANFHNLPDQKVCKLCCLLR